MSKPLYWILLSSLFIFFAFMLVAEGKEDLGGMVASEYETGMAEGETLNNYRRDYGNSCPQCETHYDAILMGSVLGLGFGVTMERKHQEDKKKEGEPLEK